MRLIDADELLKAIANSGLIWETNECLDVIETLAVKKIIDDAPTVDTNTKNIAVIPPEVIKELATAVVDVINKIDWNAAVEKYNERPTGEWLHYNDDSFDWWVCSCCKYGDEYEIEGNKPWFRFCPACGAKMEKSGAGI